MTTMTLPEQDALDGLDATRIRIAFTNTTSDSLDDLPDIEDEQWFLMRAKCVARGLEVLKDGEKRRTARMDVIVLEPQGPPFKPDQGPDLFTEPEA